MPRNGIAVSYSNSFNFGKGSSYTNLLSHQQCIRIQISPQACQHLFSVYLIIAIQLGARWPLIVNLICIFLMISNAVHLSMWLLAICISFGEKYLFESFCPFFNWAIWEFLLLSCGCLLNILYINQFLDTGFFFHSSSLCCVLHLTLTLGNTKNLLHK